MKKAIILTFFAVVTFLASPSVTNPLDAAPTCPCSHPELKCYNPDFTIPPPFKCIIYKDSSCAGDNVFHHCCHDKDNPPDCAGEIINPLIKPSVGAGSATSVVQKVIVNLVNLAYIAGVVIFFFMLITGGLQWISSGGDKMAVANARSRISHAVIGLIVLMGVFAIVSFMESLFDVDLLKIDIGLISL